MAARPTDCPCPTLSTELGGLLQAHLVGFPFEITGDTHGLATREASPGITMGNRERSSSQLGISPAAAHQKNPESSGALV